MMDLLKVAKGLRELPEEEEEEDLLTRIHDKIFDFIAPPTKEELEKRKK